jgi:D-alanyl-D-alanine carboxypeptidase/D-alanyl-D-alanine-endopeptidase (penicillin-binding protein 4)
VPQSGDSDLWPSNDDDNPRKSPSEPVKDAATHQLPVPDQQGKPATSGWFDPPKAEEPAPGRDESHAKPTQQRTQPVSWPVSDLEKQAKNQSQAATSFARPVPSAPRPADDATAFFSLPKPPGVSPAWPNEQDTSKGKEFTQSSSPENGKPKPTGKNAEKPQPEPSPTQPASRDWFAPAAPDQPAGADREAEHSDRPHATPESADSEPVKGDTTVNLFQPDVEEATPSEEQATTDGAAEPADAGQATPPEGEGRPGEAEDGGSSKDEPADQERAATSSDSEPAKGDSTVSVAQPSQREVEEPAAEAPKSPEGTDDEPAKSDSTDDLFPPPTQDTAEPATPPKSADTKSGNATNLFPPPQGESADRAPKSSEDAAKSDNAANLLPPAQREQGDQAPKLPEDAAKSGNAANLFPPPQREPGDQGPKSSEDVATGGNTTSLFPPPQREPADRLPKSPEDAAKSSNATILFPPLQGDPADRAPKSSEDTTTGGNATNLFPPPQREPGDRAPKSPEDMAKGSNAANLFPPPQREAGEPATRAPKAPEGVDSKTVFIRPVQPPRPPVPDTPPAFIRPRQSPTPPSTDPATVHIPRADLQNAQKEWPPPEPPRAAPQRVGPPPEEPPAPRKKKPLLVAGIAVVAVLALAAGVVFGVPGVAEKLGLTSEDVNIAAPPSPVSYTPGLRGPDANASGPSEQGVTSALAGPMANPALGNIAGVVIDPATGQTLYERGGATPITPASTGKLLVAAAALLSLDHTQQLVTKVVQGERPDEAIIVGGGDPTINSLDRGEESMYPGAPYLADLVDQVKSHGVPITTVYIDQSRYADPTMAPSWDPADIGNGYIAPIVPAMLDGDRQDPTTNYSQRTSNPGGKLVDTFASRIGATAPANAAKKAPADAKVLGEIRSAPMSQLVDTMLNHSDNTLGDIVAHEVAIKAGEEPSFDGSSKAVLDVLRANNFDVDGVVLRDGSGMSTENKVSAKLLAQILAVAAAPDGKDPRTGKLRPLLGGLPVAGGGGTLADRYDEGAATEGRGWVRAKTGSLTGINSLAGIVLDKDNRPLVFAFLTTGTTSTTARPALDTVSAALRGCGCQ